MKHQSESVGKWSDQIASCVCDLARVTDDMRVLTSEAEIDATEVPIDRGGPQHDIS